MYAASLKDEFHWNQLGNSYNLIAHSYKVFLLEMKEVRIKKKLCRNDFIATIQYFIEIICNQQGKHQDIITTLAECHVNFAKTRLGPTMYIDYQLKTQSKVLCRFLILLNKS